MSTLKTIVMEPINEINEDTKEKENNNNNNYIAHINDRQIIVNNNENNPRRMELSNYLKKSKQILFIYILLITMIYSSSKICYLTFITI